ncbi:MAG: PAS domain S-box protein [Nitrospirae bacterium]|nr:PAS domain S-box protein [Nitrospirota bacterium]
MRKLVELPIRVLLMLMVALIVLLAFSLIIYSGIQQRTDEINHAKQEVQSLAVLVEVQQQWLVTSAEQLMHALGSMPDLHSRNTPRVEAALAEAVRLNPQYTTIFITDRDGDIWASALPTKGKAISDRESFNKALSLGHFTAGQYKKGQYSGKQVLSFYYPYKNGKGEIIGVIILGLDLGYHKKLMENITWPNNTSYVLLDHDGVVLGMGFDKYIGERFDEKIIDQMKTGPAAGTSTGKTRDGLTRITAYRRLTLKGENDPYMYIRVGIPYDLVMANANMTLLKNLSIVIIMLSIMLYVAWIIGKRSIADRISLLKTHSGRLSAGDVTGRVSDLIKGGELGELALTFDRMADGIATREAALRQSEHRYRTLFEQSPDGIVIVDLSFRIVQFNDVACRQLGYTREEFSGLRISDIDPDESPSEIQGRTEKIMESGGAAFDVRHKTKLGEIRYHHVIAQPIVLAGETVLYAIWQDITDRKQAEEALARSEQRFQMAMQGANDGLWDWDLQTDEVYYSPRWKAMLGYKEEELDNTISTWKRLVHPHDQGPTLSLVRDLIERRKDTYEVEFKMLHKDGHYLDILSRATLVFGVSGEALRLVGTHVDITDRKRSEEALRQSEQFIRSILDTVDEGFIVIDRDYRIITANKAYCRQVGGCDEKIIGRHCYEISHKTDKPCYEEGEECATHLAFETGAPHAALHRHKDPNGIILYVETKAYPIKDDSGNVISVIEVINNITERHLLEEERLKTQKLESIGTLAGGIAHDFNNLLQGVFGYISMAKITHDQKEKSLAMLSQAEEALHMSVNLTTQLLTFSKGGSPLKKLIRLEPTVENSAKFALSGSHTDYRMNSAPDLWSVEADAGQLSQVIQNIVLNANEAMEGGGTVNISLENMNIPSNTNHRLPEGGRFVLIDIEDTGTGISGQDMARIFDPYFTTKQKGSGLGLATSYSIIKNHGGLIEVRSELNRGTTFSIYLPASKGAETATEQTAQTSAATKTIRVLLMDDEDVVRNVAQEMIGALGHEVESAEDGRKAIELFRQAREAGNPYDLVILDLTVKGGMGGEEAIAGIREIDPNVKAVVSSGYADNPVIADYRTYGFSAVLNKPYKIDSLKDCLSLFCR